MNLLSAATLAHTPSQTLTVADRIEQRALDSGERVFVFFGERQLTYAEFNSQANRVAHWAVARGLTRGDRVALMMENRPEFLVAWGGLCKLGVVTVLVNSNSTGQVLEHALSVADCSTVIVGEECLDRVASLAGNASARYTFAVMADPELGASAQAPPGSLALDQLLADQSNDNPDPSVREGLLAGDDLFHVFTSGTTGLPKAARLSHMRYLGVGDGMSAIAGYTTNDVIYCVLPLYHGAAGMVVTSSALSHGAAIAMLRRFSASRFWDDARRYGVTGCQYIGEICRYLLAQAPRDNDRNHDLRVMMGAGLGPDIWQEFQQRFGVERILEGWSSTEANTSLINLDNRVGSCGRVPFPQMHNGRLIRYDDQADSHPRDTEGFCIECEVGETGEFVGMVPDLPDSGAGRFEGYTDPEATNAKLLADVFAPGDSWYRSGDLLRRDEDGYYYFVDRVGDTFRWKSENVSTQEVAEALSGFDGLLLANVYGVRVPGTEGRAGMAALIVDNADDFDGRAFFEHCSERLASYAQPVFLRLSREADMTSTFKLRKVDLQRDGYDPADAKDDPLLVRDDAQKSFVPLSDDSLAAAGYPPFEAERDS